jgi:hypothetical protein
LIASRVAKAAHLAHDPHFDKGVRFAPGTIIDSEPQARPFGAEVHFGIDLQESEIAQLTDGQADLWLFCSVCYLDFMDHAHEVNFCWRWAQRPPGVGLHYWESDGDPPAAYTRQT